MEGIGGRILIALGWILLFYGCEAVFWLMGYCQDDKGEIDPILAEEIARSKKRLLLFCLFCPPFLYFPFFPSSPVPGLLGRYFPDSEKNLPKNGEQGTMPASQGNGYAPRPHSDKACPEGNQCPLDKIVEDKNKDCAANNNE